MPLFACAFRRSELVVLDVADIEETETGLLVTIRHSKTDQEGAGDIIAISRGDVACPVKALRARLQAAGIEAGAIFRPIGKASKLRSGRLTDRSVANIVKVSSRRFGRNRVFRSFAPIGVFGVGSCQRRLDFQDDGRITAQVRRHAPRLCP